MYHKIMPRPKDRALYPNMACTVFADEFEKQLAYLKGKYCILSAEDFISCIHNGLTFPEKSVFLTFDDGQSDFYEHALPILKKLRIPAIVFLPTDFIGKDIVFWWDELEHYILNMKKDFQEISGVLVKKGKERCAFDKLARILMSCSFEEKRGKLNAIKEKLCASNYLGKRSAMTWNEVKEAAESGISFGAHTKGHVLLSSVSDEQAKKEISEPKLIIEQHTSFKVKLSYKTVLAFAFSVTSKNAGIFMASLGF